MCWDPEAARRLGAGVAQAVDTGLSTPGCQPGVLAWMGNPKAPVTLCPCKFSWEGCHAHKGVSFAAYGSEGAPCKPQPPPLLLNKAVTQQQLVTADRAFCVVSSHQT